jgi:hypothetical protein
MASQMSSPVQEPRPPRPAVTKIYLSSEVDNPNRRHKNVILLVVDGG